MPKNKYISPRGIRPLNQPAFPVGAPPDTKCATLGDLFAMFAPEPPRFFEPKTPSSSAAQLERFIRWRLVYAELMLEARQRHF
jgi:hypothetical protein